MTKMIRAIRIDPFAKTVTEIQHDVSDYRNIYKAISVPEHPVDTFTVLTAENGDGWFMDDNGLLNGPTMGFEWSEYPRHALAGCALVLGTTPDGDSTNCKTTLAEAQAAVKFVGEIDSDAILAANPPQIVGFDWP